MFVIEMVWQTLPGKSLNSDPLLMIVDRQIQFIAYV